MMQIQSFDIRSQKLFSIIVISFLKTLSSWILCILLLYFFSSFGSIIAFEFIRTSRAPVSVRELKGPISFSRKSNHFLPKSSMKSTKESLALELYEGTQSNFGLLESTISTYLLTVR